MTNLTHPVTPEAHSSNFVFFSAKKMFPNNSPGFPLFIIRCKYVRNTTLIQEMLLMKDDLGFFGI